MKPPDSPRAAFCLAGKEAKSRITPCKARNAEKGVTVKEQQISYRDISEIHPYEHNPRNNDAAVEPVTQSIKNFGFRVPILVDREGTIIAGHTRYKAAQLLGMERVPCILVDDLSDEQVRAYRIADNKVAEASSWDEDILRIEMETLKALNVDLEQTGFTDLEVDGILREMQDVDFEDFFIEPVQKPAERAQQEPSPQRDEEDEVRQPASESPAKRIKCPHCGAWIDL